MNWGRYHVCARRPQLRRGSAGVLATHAWVPDRPGRSALRLYEWDEELSRYLARVRLSLVWWDGCSSCTASPVPVCYPLRSPHEALSGLRDLLRLWPWAVRNMQRIREYAEWWDAAEAEAACDADRGLGLQAASDAAGGTR